MPMTYHIAPKRKLGYIRTYSVGWGSTHLQSEAFPRGSDRKFYLLHETDMLIWNLAIV